jgi:hypothetical protein
MKNFNTGQLVHVPAGAYRMKVAHTQEQYKIPFSANIMTQPMVGIYKESVDYTTSVVVFHDGEWIVEDSCIYTKNEGENHVGIDKCSQDRSKLVSA